MARTSTESPDSAAEPRRASIKAFPEAIIAETNGAKLFSRTGDRITFDTSSLDDYYKPIDTYEGRHRYDPTFEWTPAEEKRVVRKVSIFSCCTTMYRTS